MATLSTNDNDSDYWVKDDTKKKFFKIPEFCSSLQQYLSKLLSIQVDISLQTPPKKNRWSDEPMAYRIRITGTYEDKPKLQRSLFDFMEKFLNTVKSVVLTDDDKALKWQTMTGKKLKFLQNLVNKKISDIITVFLLESKKLVLYYLPKQPLSKIDVESLMNFIQNEVLTEVIALPLPHERSPKLDNELEEITSEENKNDEVLIIQNDLARKNKQKEITIFGYNRKVLEIKKQVLNIIETNILITFKLNPMATYSIDTYSDELAELEKQHKHSGVELRLRLNEFLAPRFLKEEIESFIHNLLSQTSETKVFESIELYKTIAENEDQYWRSIAKNNNCFVKTQLKHNYQSHPVPKASSSNKQVSKCIIAESEAFCSSTDVFRKMIVANGSIELRTGDIALYQADSIIIPTMFNGVREGLIERLGEIDYEKTHLESDGTMYTETNGGKLNCKRVLFSNWLPNSLVNTDNTLRSSIKKFVSKSIEHIVQGEGSQSIAFVVPDTCTNEVILAEEMIGEAKRQLETNNLQLKISFICLPEQQTLYEQFSNIIPTNQDAYAYIDWPTTTIEITLIGPTLERVTLCQKRIEKYFARCISSVKLTLGDDIFQFWDQHTINSFYKYCKDRCVVAKIGETKNEIILNGPATSVLEIKKKFYVLSELMKEKQNSAIIIERPSSAISQSVRSENKINIKMTTLYNIVISFNSKDLRKCQRLMKRLTEEGFSIGTYLNTAKEKRDLRSQMDKSDCIILCVSENYYESVSCIEEAKYAFQTDKKVFIVKIQSNPVLGWDSHLFEGKFFFYSFGSENYFDLEYGRLLLELLRYTKPGFISLVQQRSNRTLQTTNDSRNLAAIDQQPPVEDKTIRPSLKSQNMIIDVAGKEKHLNDNFKKKELNFFEERWLRKLTHSSASELLILTQIKSFDIGDVPRHVRLSIYHASDVFVQSLVSTNRFPYFSFRNKTSDGDKSMHSKSRQDFIRPSSTKILIDEDQAKQECTERIQCFAGISQVFPDEKCVSDFIPRRKAKPYSFFSSLSYYGDSYERSEAELEKRRELDDPEKMKHIREKFATYFIETYKRYSKEDLDSYLKFAQRMKDNALAFEAFCSTTTC